MKEKSAKNQGYRGKNLIFIGLGISKAPCRAGSNDPQVFTNLKFLIILKICFLL